MANWLKNYNKDIIGMSVGSHFGEVTAGIIIIILNSIYTTSNNAQLIGNFVYNWKS